MIGAGRLHSRYRPEAEADRYVEALNPAHDIDYFILVEPGMGYLIDALRKCRPGSKAVVLRADAAFRELESLRPDVPVWYPGDKKTVQEFLEAQIPEGASARIVEWRPSLLAYGKACLELVRESAAFIKRADASSRTSAAFGRRWVRNFFRNLTILRTALLYERADTPVVVTGSGPGLEAALPEILAARDGVFVLASSSSLPALAAGGVIPDMAIGTDGGGWALMHLHACFRLGGAPSPRLACALSAALPSRCSELSVLPVCDGSLWQTIALNAAGVPSALVPPRGTVTATALELALALGAGWVFLAGMDLSVDGVRSHARPYEFDNLLFGAASRLRPAYSQAFARSGDIRAGGSHEVYAAWFRSRLASWSGRVFSLGGRGGVFESAPSLAPFLKAGSPGGDRRDRFRELSLKGLPGERCRLAGEALIAALGDPKRAPALAGELAPLLFPSRCDSPAGSDLAGDLAEELRGIAGRYSGWLAGPDLGEPRG